MRIRRATALITGGLLGLQLVGAPAVGAASPITITADRPQSVPAGHLWGFNDFFPRTLSVHRGQTIVLAIAGFHTVTLLPAGVGPNAAMRSMGFLTPDADDTTRNPNGSTHSENYLPAAFPMPGGCGTSAAPCAFNGTSPVSTGLPLAGPVPPTSVNVTAPLGTYRFICLVHPKMTGWLNVVARSKPATTRAQVAAKIASQAAADRRAGFAAEAIANIPVSHRNADGTRTWLLTAGTGSPDGHVAVNEMLPRKVTIHKGDRVAWVSRSVNEPHTVTFPRDIQTDIVPLCEGAGGVDTPATPTVIPPTGPFDFACGAGPPDELENDGGNGVRRLHSPSTVADSGMIASAAELAGFGLPATAANARWSVRTSTAVKGTYTYVCQIHDGMDGKIVIH
jgi:plastocyanin